LLRNDPARVAEFARILANKNLSLPQLGETKQKELSGDIVDGEVLEEETDGPE
jgi:hypothetical protein